ncbi:MAG: GSCFA domain-containing protein [Crocinitomicaceae bacterium]
MSASIERLDFHEEEVNLVHGEKIVLLGSCFSNNFAPKFIQAGFETLSNPLGTIFHPLALSEIIQCAFESNPKERLVNRDDLWFDWRASSTIYGMSREEIQSKMDATFSILKNALTNAGLLVVTFGTTWGYHLNSGEIVANCHKIPQDNFEKKMTSLEVLLSAWKETLELLRKENPKLKVVFSVSPVDHVKDGMVGNSRSKARLIELIAKLEEEGAAYFCSYELAKDRFSDSKFYEADQLHLNAHAIEMIWQSAQIFFLNPESLALASQVMRVNHTRDHRPIHPESRAARELKEKVALKMQELSRQHPEIYWK